MTMFCRMVSRVAVAAAAALVAATAAAGQQGTNLADLSGSSSGVAPGWSMTPGLLFSQTYDDNVLLRGPGDPLERDYISIINPRADVTYNGPGALFSAKYDGAFAAYNRLSTLNSYNQHASLFGRRRLSKRNTFFFDGSANAAPTTEFLQLSGIPFVRTGVFTDNARAGVETVLTERTTMSVDGRFEQARFNENDQFASLLLGGHSVGADVNLRHRISERTTLTADLDAQHASIGSAREQFDIQHALGGIERQLSEGMRVFVGGGASRLGASSFGPARTGPSWKVGFVERHRDTLVDVSYNRSFIPSFGFGGTTQNEEVLGHLHLPITRALYTTDLVSWRRADPLVIEISRLRTVWLEVAVGYTARPWIRIEGFFNGTRQYSGGLAPLTHNQFGIQVVTGTPVRIR
jgi:hypothetical protein